MDKRITDLPVEKITSRTLIAEALNKHTEEVIRMTGESMNKEYKKKFEKGKGRPITVTIYCVPCSNHFTIKGKSNKSDADQYQICPHTIMKNWEVNLGSS